MEVKAARREACAVERSQTNDTLLPTPKEMTGIASDLVLFTSFLLLFVDLHENKIRQRDKSMNAKWFVSAAARKERKFANQ